MLYGQLAERTVDGSVVNAIKVSIPNPPKVAYVRLPNNKELTDYFKPTKGKKEESSENKALDMFNAIRLDKGEEFDEYEAASAIDTLMKTNGDGFERIGNTYVIKVETQFGSTEHTLNIPTQKQITFFRRSAIKNYLNAVTALYDELVEKVDGYVAEITAKDVPPHHKLDVVNQAFAALDSLDPLLDPNS